ncbi:hypothetical protein [Singulisphaera sp. PoT]|uniref:hypothetical protein n=1 Tax=Singulisphaera sp. PoT TaxID=3411797 RepID=UPI003BF5283B
MTTEALEANPEIAAEQASHTPERAPLTEEARRLPTWQPGIPMKLCDGSVWHFPKPRMRFPLGVDSEGRFSLTARGAVVRLGPTIDDAIDAALEAENDRESLEAAATMAVLCLLASYHVEDDELERLFWYEPDDQANLDIWLNILAFAGGYQRDEEGQPVPKGGPTAAGSE